VLDELSLDDPSSRAPGSPGWRRRLDDAVAAVRGRPAHAALVALSAALVAIALWWLLRPPAAVAPESVLPVVSSATSPRRTGASSGTAANSGASPAPSATASTLVVHVAGAVQRPGVLRLPTGARVVDALDAAGGAAPDADTDRVNLAAPLGDGAWLHVPRVGEPSLSPPAEAGSAGAAGGTAAPVDLNTASAAQLEALPGIGPSTAAAIVEHRNRRGPFASVESLADVPGIGESKLARIRPLVRV
jgi:competence protein ComEA